MRVPVSIRTSYFMADKKAPVDSGATDNFMHPAFAKRMECYVSMARSARLELGRVGG
jgi:hypothetical protein